MLTQRKNQKSGKVEYCLVSKSSGQVLEWYGAKRPSAETVQASERRIKYHEHKGK